MNTYTARRNGHLFIRIPKDLVEGEELVLKLDKSLAGKTLYINGYDNYSNEVPFESDVLCMNDEASNSEITYFGDDSYWEPRQVSREVIEGYPSCKPGECTKECHMVSCPVWQGYVTPSVVTISYLTSSKL